jgi:hypothetical protein
MIERLSKNAPCLVLLASMLIGLMAPSASAHIVKPEQYHPVAEAYRRAMFMLNLNPVQWKLVETETERIALGYGDLGGDDAKRYALSMQDAIAMAIPESKGVMTDPALRKETARGIFEQSTEAVAHTLTLHLEATRNALTDQARARDIFEVARQLWAAFEYEIKTADPTMHRELGGAWLRCSSAIGSPGLAGIGAVPVDIEIFDAESKRIADYVTENFRNEYSAAGHKALMPLPTRSDSYDSSIAIPAKLPPGSNLNKQLPRPRQILTMATVGVDEGETFLIALGDMAFDSPYIFGEPAQSLGLSCNVCHNKGVTNPNFFIPGLSTVAGGLDVSNSFFAPHANNGHYDPLDTPDLRGIRFTAPYGRNGRFASLREFVRNVIVNEFNGPEPEPILLDAMIAYMNEFDFLPNDKLHRDGTLNDTATASAKRGELLFMKPFPQMDGKSCATCHIPSNNFLDGDRHDIGSTMLSESYARNGALDTPTLLSAKFSAPYFHDGSQPTLRAVTEWFDEHYNLGLSEGEIADLTAYVETVGDGIDGMEDTLHTLDAELEEFSFFLSTYEYLQQKGNTNIINALLQTIELEVGAHKWSVQDMQQLPVLNQLESLMADAYGASLTGDSPEVHEAIQQFREIYEQNKETLK